MAPAVPAAPLALLLQLAIVVVALLGVNRLTALRALADDPRLRRLSWFFGLFAAAVAVEVLVSFALVGHRASLGHPLLRVARLSLLEHGLMIAALVVAVRAFAQPWKGAAAAPPAAAAAVMLAGRFGALGFVEAAIALYLAVAALANSRHRRTRGAWRVAAGFGLFFLGHLSYWVFQKTGAVRPFWADALTLASIAILVAAVPRRKALDADTDADAGGPDGRPPAGAA